MSSHREAPEIAKDPVADSTDIYAFVSPDRPDTVTIIANFIPLQKPDGGPNFYEFGDDVLYEIRISNNGRGEADIIYTFDFHTKIRNPEHLPLQHRPDHQDRRDATWNRPQFYTVTRVENGSTRVLAHKLAVPPVNVGTRSTPDYAQPRRPGRAHDAAAARCSPASAPTRSTSTSAASSTSAGCARSTRRT